MAVGEGKFAIPTGEAANQALILRKFRELHPKNFTLSAGLKARVRIAAH